MRISAEWDNGPAQNWLAEWRNVVPERRRELVRQLTAFALQGVVQANPVETGRSRAAWVAAGEQLGCMPQGAWQGTDAAAMGEGAARGRGPAQETADVSEMELANGVSYVPILEYGSSKMSPRAMVRQTLQQTGQQSVSIAEAVLLRGE